MAQDPAAYLAVRTEALEVLSRLHSVQENEFSFRAAVLAADASYFGHRVSGDRTDLSLSVMLADLAAAANYARAFPRARGSQGLSNYWLSERRSQCLRRSARVSRRKWARPFGA